MVEVDVQVTADGRLVVMHDETLDRTTDGHGAVRDKTWAEIRALDAGAWFAPEFEGQRVLGFEELLDLLGNRAALNAEIKAPPEDWPRLVPAMLGALANAGCLERTVISCFNFAALEAVRQASRDARLGVLWFSPDLDPAWKAIADLGAVSLHPYVGICGRPLFEEAARRSVATYVWTVNDRPTIRRLVQEGADGVMSDHPELFDTVAEGCE